MPAISPEADTSIGIKSDLKAMRKDVTFEPSESRARKQLEEHLNSLKQVVNRTCECTLASVQHLEVEAEALRAENAMLREKVMRAGETLPGAIQEETTELRTVGFHDDKPPPVEECPVLLLQPGVQSTYRRSNNAFGEYSSERTPIQGAEQMKDRTSSTQKVTTLMVPPQQRVATINSKLSDKPKREDTAQSVTNKDDIEESWVAQFFKPRRQSTMRPIFADAEHLKDKVRMRIAAPEYDVRNFYKTEGWCQQIARSNIFENVTMFVIGLNAVWAGIESDYNDEAIFIDSDAIFQFAGHAFCTYFAVEWLIRFISFANKRNCFLDGWFVFDTILVFLTIGDTWVVTIIFAFVGTNNNSSALKNASTLRLLRLLRLTRMARIFHLLRAFPEIMIIIKGIFVATRSVLFTLVLLVVILYVFAVAFSQLTQGLPVADTYFGKVPRSMQTLLMNGTFLENIPDVFDACVRDSIIAAIMLLCYILLAALTVMNMLIGVLCEVISVVSAVEKEGLVTSYVKVFLEKMCEEVGVNLEKGHEISKRDFELLVEHPDATRCLDSVGVDVIGLIDFVTHMLDGDDSSMSFIDFVELVLTLRGSNVAKVKDIVDLRKYIFIELGRKQDSRDKAIEDRVQSLESMTYRATVAIHPELRQTLLKPPGEDDLKDMRASLEMQKQGQTFF